jgi:uncharacterized protein YndB with AHSA1/START domain
VTIATEVETTIARPPAQVFEALADIERFPTWLIASGIVRVERLDGGPLAPGSAIRIEQRVGGRASTLEGSITTLEASHAFGLRGRDRDGVTIEIDATVAAGGPGSRLRWSVRIALPLRYRMFESMVAPQVRQAAILDIEAFRRRLEAAAPA